MQMKEEEEEAYYRSCKLCNLYNPRENLKAKE